MNTTLSERLKLIRGKIPQAEFADSVGINKSSWGRYERGETEPTSSDLIKICGKYEISSVWLLFGEGPMHPGEAPQPLELQANAPGTPPEAAGACPRCAKLEEKLERVERQRDELVNENRDLLRENGDLREENATMRERLRVPTHTGTMDRQTA